MPSDTSQLITGPELPSRRSYCSLPAGSSRGNETLRGFAAVALARPTAGLSGAEASESPALIFVGDRQVYLRDARTLEPLEEPLPVAQVARVCTGLNGQRVTIESLSGAPPR